jgi:hypothetical protein
VNPIQINRQLAQFQINPSDSDEQYKKSQELVTHISRLQYSNFQPPLKKNPFEITIKGLNNYLGNIDRTQKNFGKVKKVWNEFVDGFVFIQLPNVIHRIPVSDLSNQCHLFHNQWFDLINCQPMASHIFVELLKSGQLDKRKYNSIAYFDDLIKTANIANFYKFQTFV